MISPARRTILAALALPLLLAPISAASALAAPPPTAVDDTYETDEDAQLEVAAVDGVLANDGTPAEGNEFCVASVDDSGLHGSLTWAEDGSFTYTPDGDYNGEGSGNAFTYTMHEVAIDDPCDSSQGDTAAVEITVNAVNDAPTAAHDSFQAIKNTTLIIGAPGVLSNDSDIDGDSLTAKKTENPTHGILVWVGDGSFSYTPANNYTGVDTFSYYASDGELSSPTRVVTITVSGIPPINTPTPIPTLPPTPTPAPTLTPIITEPPVDVTLEPGASPTAFVPPTPQLSGAVPSAAPSAGAPSPAPGRTPDPDETSGSGFGSPLSILLGLTLVALVVGVAAAIYGPGWLERRRARDG